MPLKDISYEAIELLSQINKEFSARRINGYVLMIDDSLNENKKTVDFLVANENHKKLILKIGYRASKKTKGFTPGAYTIIPKEGVEYSRIY